jgi:chemotaxis protein methyltransferase CheR
MTISSSDFDYVRSMVRDRAAIVLESDKQYLVDARLVTLAFKEGFPSVGELVAKLRVQPRDELIRKVVEAMTTNETMFFRDIHPFEVMRKYVLPDMINKRAGQRALNLWCGASSSGQEPYSVMMLLREHFPQLASWNTSFIATDLSSEILAKARAGVYNQLEVNRGLPAPLLLKYFTKQGMSWQIKDELRKAIDFREMNLCKPWPSMPELDIVFLRNVLIYFDVEMKKQILGRIRRQLRPDGYLFVGSAETTLNLDDNFVPVMHDKTVCYKLRS